MLVTTDLHVHSKYSRATSKVLDPRGLFEGARVKGIDIIATGDFTHPRYLEELKEQLTEAPAPCAGLFSLKGEEQAMHGPFFMLSQEISCIYSHDGKVRRNHVLVYIPDFKTADALVLSLGKVGNLSADGRPILGISSEELAKIVFDANEDNVLIPAHIWTPWFSLFGSKSGYDSLEHCFGSMTKHIYAVETGLSSDPVMNWRVSQLDGCSLVSHGDAHSARKIGREATVYELEQKSYYHIVDALKNSAKLNKNELPKNYILHTIEFYPEEGKYHYDGHRVCGVCFSPDDTKRAGGVCPKCRKALTLGVDYRVHALADRTVEEADAYARKHRPWFKKIVPLEEIIADAVGQNPGTKKVQHLYDALIKKAGSEFMLLLNLSKKELSFLTAPEIVEGILRVRSGDIHVSPGYDGEFGHISVFTQKERESFAGTQAQLF